MQPIDFFVDPRVPLIIVSPFIRDSRIREGSQIMGLAGKRRNMGEEKAARKKTRRFGNRDRYE